MVDKYSQKKQEPEAALAIYMPEVIDILS